MKLFIVLTLTFVSLAGAQELDLHKETSSYNINYGESLGRIALEHKVSVSYLLSINENSIGDPDIIYAGQKIKVPNKKAIEFITEKSLMLKPFLLNLGAEKSKVRMKAVKEMIRQDWRVIPLLLEALKDKDVEVKENAREALKAIHQSKARVEKLSFKTKEKKEQ